MFILKFQKNWIKVTMISNIKLKSFQINLMLELFICLILELLKLLINFYSLGVTIYFWNLQFQFFDDYFFVFTFFLI
jgi:hypothetical protein